MARPTIKIDAESAVTGQNINWFPQVEVSGPPFKGCLEIRAGRVYLVLPVTSLKVSRFPNGPSNH
jgi:hypothetical protein